MRKFAGHAGRLDEVRDSGCIARRITQHVATVNAGASELAVHLPGRCLIGGLSPAERRALEVMAASVTLPHRAVREAKGLLLAADGVANSVIGERLGVSRSTVLGWRHGFLEHGIDWVGKVRPGRGQKPTISQGRIEAMVHDTLHTAPPDGATHWSVRSMARHSGLSKSTIQKEWSARGIKPHLIRTFKLSNDKRFEEKLRDVVDLYMNPPEDSVVLSVDEKSQIQALNRTQPSLPMIPGRAGTLTHDYKRNGTTTLFAALNIATGLLLFKCMPRHRNLEFVHFLRVIDRSIDNTKKIHLIVDNYGTHKHPNVRAWLERHPRFTLHFNRPARRGSTSSSAGSASSPTRRSGAAASPASPI